MMNTFNTPTFRKIAALGFSAVSLSTLSSTSLAQGQQEAQGAPTKALVLTVDQSEDNTTGSCEADVQGQCNLRAAVAKAVATSGRVNIRLAVDSNLTGGEIAITSPAETLAPFDLRIIGNENQKKITGNASTKLFTISTNINVTLRNVLISNFQAYNAGVITNAGSLTLARTVIRGNKATCSGIGAMTAFATCYAGAIENTGALILKNGTRFRDNLVEATASTASFTNANANGGAIVSNGSITFDGRVVFRHNIASAIASSGYHGNVPSGANASSSGGAISNSGTITVTEAGQGQCRFLENEAKAVASNGQQGAVSSSAGGAIATSALEGVDLSQSCTFENNQADTDADIYIYPAS